MTQKNLQDIDVRTWLKNHENKDLLRFLTCGSVDDGKSTLIGRLLYNSKMIYEDQLSALEKDNEKHGHAGDELDFSLLVDGLAAEREQGITIDVAWRYFSTDTRKFIIADTPGHEQYTRNMATGASGCQLAIILIDARKGVLTQTRRHSLICHLLGIKQLIIAVNKMDLMDYDQHTFDAIIRDYHNFIKQLKFHEDLDLQFVPISALKGDNITEKSPHMDWYKDDHLLGLLENASTIDVLQNAPFRFPVQYVNRPNIDFRGFAGTITSGRIHCGDEILAMPSMQYSTIDRIVTMDGELQEAAAGQAITITLKDEIDISRGDMITVPTAAPSLATEVTTNIVWMQKEPLKEGRLYRARFAAAEALATISKIHYVLDVNTMEKSEAQQAGLNSIVKATVCFNTRIPLETYRGTKSTGSFILIDRDSHSTAGAVMVTKINREELSKNSSDVVWHNYQIDRSARAELKAQKPKVLWFTGLSGSGKSTIANLVEQRLFNMGRHTYLLDGDNVRHGLNKNLGFSGIDRIENIRRVAEVSRLMYDAGLIVIATFISPFRSDRHMARELFDMGDFIEIYIDTPLHICEQRDPKGLYKKARKGEIAHFTGISSPYEAPYHSEIRIKTEGLTPEECAEQILKKLETLA